MATAKFRYTEHELKDRHVGTFIDKRSCDNVTETRYATKNATYTDEAVVKAFNKLRNSFHVFLKDYTVQRSGYIDTKAADKCAQMMIDSFLIRRARGEDVKIPCEIRSVETVVIKAKGTEIELYDADLFQDGDGVSENEMIRWVNKNMLVSGIQAEDAPCAAAFGMLLHYRETSQRREKFYDTLVPKLLSKEDAAKGDKLKDDGKDVIELCGRLLKALPEEE